MTSKWMDRDHSPNYEEPEAMGELQASQQRELRSPFLTAIELNRLLETIPSLLEGG